MTAEVEDQIARLRQGEHICLIYETAAEQLTAAVSFIKDGLARGERCIYIADDGTFDEVDQALAGAGVDVAQQRQRGALRVLTSQDTYLRAGEFSPLAMIDFIRQAEAEALADGFSGLRLTAEPTWSLEPRPGSDRLIEYEAFLNDLPANSKSVLLCQYNRTRFGAPCIHDVLRTHPVAILGDQVCPNPYCELPELVLSKDQAAATSELQAKRVDWWIAQLKWTRAAELERERAETALRESEARLREIVDLIPAAVYVCDKNGIVQQFNRKAVELWGREPCANDDVRFCGAIQHLRLDGTVIPRDKLPIVETIRNGTPVRNKELVIERADGSQVVVMVNIAPIRNTEGAPVGAINCFLDVTDRRQAEERLRQSERRLTEAQQVAHFGSWERDLRTNEVNWSDELYSLFGLRAEEIDLSYEQFLNLLVPQDMDRIRVLVDEALRERRSFNCDYRITLPDGSVRVLHDRGSVILSESGEPIRLVGTCQDVTELRQAEQALQEYAARLQSLSHRLLEVQEAERRHLARELHDELGQLLTSLNFAVEAAAAAPAKAVGAHLAEARTLIGQALNQVRELSLDLRPTHLDHLGLLPALRWLVERFSTSTGVRVNLQQARLDRRFAPAVETAAYRVVQEGLTNVARHASVPEIAVRVWVDEGTLKIQLEDQGTGFDPDAALSSGRSSGLPGMRERVALLGGRLTIESSPGAGTHLQAEIPLGESGT